MNGCGDETGGDSGMNVTGGVGEEVCVGFGAGVTDTNSIYGKECSSNWTCLDI